MARKTETSRPKRPARRIALIIPDFAGGGAQRVMLAVAGAAIADGRAVSLIVMNGDGPLAASVPAGTEVEDLRQPRLRAAIPSLRKTLRRVAPNVAMTTINYLNIGAMLANLGWGGAPPLILREANQPSAIFPTGGGIGARMRLQATRWLYPRAAALLSPSARVADEMAEIYRVARRAVTVIPNPVDGDHLRALVSEREPRPRDGIIRFIAAGRLTKQKGYDRLLDDLAALDRDGFKDWRLDILGEGEDRAPLEGQAARRGLSDKIAFPGFDPAPWARIAGADAFLLPSRWEGMPNAALEALALGTPVIATPEAGGITEIADAVHEAGNADAITLAKAGPHYRDALKAVSPGDGTLAPPLLPPMFRQDTVMAAYLDLLDRVARG